MRASDIGLVLTCLLIAFGLERCGQCDSVAHGQETMSAEMQSEVLARCIVAEAGRSPGRDAAAMLHVLERRRTLPRFRHGTTADVAMAYCTVYELPSASERQVRMLALTRASMPSVIVSFTDAWVAGRRPADPCAGKAWHWSDGSFFTPLPRVECGNTSNTFYGAAKP